MTILDARLVAKYAIVVLLSTVHLHVRLEMICSDDGGGNSWLLPTVAKQVRL